jgi:hypothetical protein
MQKGGRGHPPSGELGQELFVRLNAVSAADFLAVDYFAFLAAPFLAAVDLFAADLAFVAAPFLAAVDLFAADLAFVAAPFLAAVDLLAADLAFVAAPFLAAVDLLAAVDFFATGMVHLLSSRVKGPRIRSGGILMFPQMTLL